MYAKSMMNGIRFPPPASESLVNAMRCGKNLKLKFCYILPRVAFTFATCHSKIMCVGFMEKNLDIIITFSANWP
jgi:hypothetical protein